MDAEVARARFLEAERQASELIDLLESLRAEIGRYREARESLDRVGDATAEVVEALRPAAQRMADLIATLEGLGLPVLGANLEAIKHAIERIESSQQESLELQGQQLTAAEVESLLKKSTADVTTRLDAASKKTDSMTSTLGTLGKVLAQQEDKRHKGMRMAFTLLGALLLITIANFIFFFLRMR